MLSFKRASFHNALIAALGLIIYSNTLQSPFHYDDITNIFQNPATQDPFGLWTGLTTPRYAGYMSFTLNYILGGVNPVGYHQLNILVHISCAMLVYSFVVLTLRTPLLIDSDVKRRGNCIALLAGLLFVSHPVQTQAVTYIVQRFTSLSAMFYLLSLVLYVKWRLTRRRGIKGVGLYVLSLLCALLAVKTKETAFTLPLAIGLYEGLFFEGRRRRFLSLAPFIIIIALIPLSLASGSNLASGGGGFGEDMVEGISEASRLQTSMSRWDYLFTEFRVIVTYARLLFFPVGQNLDYDYPIYRSFFDPPVFLSFLFLTSVLALTAVLALRPGKNIGPRRFAAFGIFWFFLTLTPESTIIPIADVIYEHRMYMPLAGLFPSISLAVIALGNPARLGSRIAALLIATLVLSGAAYARNSVWSSGVALWADASGKSPRKVRPNYNLANAYAHAGLTDKAIEQYAYVIRLKPDSADAYNNMGVAYAVKGANEKAEESFNAALRIRPDFAGAHFNLGFLYERLGKTDDAIRHYVEAVKIDPGYEDAKANLRALSVPTR